MAVIRLKTIGQKLSKDGAYPLITSGDKKVDSVMVTLDDTWQADFISAYYFVVWTAPENIYKVSMDIGNGDLRADIPNDALKSSQTLTFGIYAENANKEKVLTSSLCKMFIEHGTPTEVVNPQDWEQFKKDIIEALNNNFNAGLAEDASNEAVVEAVQNAEISASAKSSIIQTIKNHFGVEIADDADVSEIVAELIQIETSEDAREAVISALNSHFSVTVEADTTAELIEKISEIPTYTEGYNTAKAEDEPIITELQSEISTLSQDKPTIVNAINANFDTSISTDLTASEIATEVAEIPTASEARTDVINVINTSTGSTLPTTATDEQIAEVLRGLGVPYPYMSATATEYTQAEDWLTPETGGLASNFVNAYAPNLDGNPITLYFVRNTTPQRYYREFIGMLYINNRDSTISTASRGVVYRYSYGDYDVREANDSIAVYIKAGQKLEVVKYEFNTLKNWVSEKW